jgi:hypothetical protein
MKPRCPVVTRQIAGLSAGVSLQGMTASHLLCAALVCLFANCSSASMVPGRSGRAAVERVVTSSDFGGTVSVRQGDVLVVRPPMAAAEWQVSYDKTFLEFQGAPETIAHPDTNGWTFHIVRAGETSLTVTPVRRGGPNPPRFNVSIHIDA